MRLSNRLRTTVIAQFTLLATLSQILLTGCSHGGPISAKLQPDVERPRLGAVIFLCDGFDPDYVAAGCREGWLPNIKKRFADEG
ncbi:MAG: hypothetical protein JXO22_09490, partial [Phycisphaerae bacterium]|nr:hypothetical protein [Phycisphaerae bacterium]